MNIITIIGTIILVPSLVIAAVFILIVPFILVWRGYVIPRRWRLVEATVTGLKPKLPGGRMWIEIKYTVDEQEYESRYLMGYMSGQHCPPVGSTKIRYYNPINPTKTASIDNRTPMLWVGIFMLIFNYGIIIALLSTG